MVKNKPGVPIMAEQALTIREFCREIGLSLASYHRLRQAGKGPAFVKYNARVVRIRRDDAERWIRERTVQSAATVE